MSECRICLAIKKNVRCIFEPTDQGITTYADMITYVASVKIIRSDGITDQICLGCRKKLRDLYEFKLLIHRSNTSLHQKVNSHMKTINFNNITEIKLEIDVLPTDDNYLEKEYEDIKNNLLTAENSICYNNTTIRKLESKSADADIKEPMSVIDFLNTIKEDPDDNYDNDFDGSLHEEQFEEQSDNDNDKDDEYIPHFVKGKKDKRKRDKKKKNLAKLEKTKNGMKRQVQCKKVPIKPIILNDLRVMKTLVPKKPRNTAKGKYKPKTKESICPYCGKITKSLHAHLLVHGEPKFKCDQCTKAYYTKGGLDNHKNMHSNIRAYKCDQCIAAFHGKDLLRSHMANHQDVKKFVCEVCSKSYKRKHQLERHVRTHNSANKSFQCEQCNMSFFSNYGLRHHMRVHTGERPYNCELCSQPYSYKHDFNRHCMKKHGIFLKRRSVNVMNEEVLARERVVMKELMLRARGVVPQGEPLIPFEGRNAYQAFEQAINTFRKNPLALENKIWS